jgi:hypothetical protein
MYMGEQEHPQREKLNTLHMTSVKMLVSQPTLNLESINLSNRIFHRPSEKRKWPGFVEQTPLMSQMDSSEV